MDLTLPTPSRMRTPLVSALCLMGIGGALYLLDRDLAAPRGIARGAPIGSVTRCDDRVRRKPSSSLLWGHVGSGDALYLRDAVKVGPRGAASLQLNGADGRVVQLELGENSFVILDDTKDMALNFVSGSFIVRDERGDREVSIAADGNTATRELGARLLEPLADATTYAAAGTAAEVRFGWERRGAADAGLILEAKPVGNGVAKKIAAAGGGTTLALPAGEYLWRLSDRSGPVTESRRLSVASVRTPEPLSPAANAAVSVWGNGSPLRFRWTSGAVTADAGYLLEVASDAGFADPVVSETIRPETGEATVRGIPEGALQWRIRAKLPGLELASAPVAFAVTHSSSPPLEILEPASGSTSERRARLAFRWRFEGEGAPQYRWELAPAEASAETLRQLPASGSEIEWTDPTPGEYRWRVALLSGEELLGTSPWQTLTVVPDEPLKILAPADGATMRYWTEPTPFTFEWEPSRETGARYRILVGTDEAIERAKAFAAAGPRLASDGLHLAPGDYFWRVQAIDAKGLAFKTSSARKFSFGPYPLPTAPQVSVDRVPAKITLGSADARPELQWEAVKDAEGYEVTVRQGDRVVSQAQTKGTAFRLPELKAGGYTWSVRALDKRQRKGAPSPARPLQVEFGKRLGAPEADVEVE